MSLTPRPLPPTTPQALQAWLTSSPPYHITAPPPSVHDFTTPELTETLNQGLRTFTVYRTDLQHILTTLRHHQLTPQLVHAVDILDHTTPGPIKKIPVDEFSHLILAAKVADSLEFLECLVGLAAGIRVLRRECEKMRRLQDEEGKKEGSAKTGRQGGLEGKGDGDDWFSVEEEVPQKVEEEREGGEGVQENALEHEAEQEELYADIEIQLGTECLQGRRGGFVGRGSRNGGVWKERE